MSTHHPWTAAARDAANSDTHHMHGSPAASGGSPRHFDILPDGPDSMLYSVSFMILDASIELGKFGGITALTNGIKIEMRETDNTLITQFADGNLFKTTASFAMLTGDMSLLVADAGDDLFLAHWSVSEYFGGRGLDMGGHKIRITLQDDLTGLTTFHAHGHGIS